MEMLLHALVSTIQAGLPYLSWVGVLDSELLPPEEPPPPFVGLRDGGIVPASLPGQSYIEVLTVHVIPYQSVNIAFPGGAVLGSQQQLGTQGMGLLAISNELQVLLSDNYMGLPLTQALWTRTDATQAITSADGRILSYQSNHFVYRRLIS